MYKKTNKKVPSLITKTLDYISNYFSTQIGVGSQIDVWLESNMDLLQVKTLVESCQTGQFITRQFKNVPISVVIGFFKRYLFELPVSVCSFDIYEPLKLLYLSSKLLSFFCLFYIKKVAAKKQR